MKIPIGTSQTGKPFDVPIDMVTQTVAIVGIRGSGKTNTAVVAAEGMLARGQQVVVLDPLDIWYGLRSSANGREDGFPVVVLGGEHSDLPLEAGTGRTVADFVADQRASVILSTRHLSKTKQRSFVADFCEQLYHRKGKANMKTPMHIFIDEADAFAPQRLEGDVARCFGAIDDLVRRGRSSGFGVTCITQRPAVLNKDVLTQVEMLIIHRILSPQDRKAIEAWVEVHDAEGVADTVLGTLHTLGRGEAWIWSPSWLGLLDRVAISKRSTFDSSYTPKVGETASGPKKVAAVDLEALKAAMGETLEKAKANDPTELKRRIAELERQVKASPKSSLPAKPIEIPIMTQDQANMLAAFISSTDKMGALLNERSNEIKSALADQRGEAVRLRGEIISRTAPRTPSKMHTPRPAAAVSHRVAREVDLSHVNGSSEIGTGGLRRMLAALANRPAGLSARQLGVRSGMSSNSGTFSTYLGRARAAGWINGGREGMQITEDGLAALGAYEALPTGSELLAFWLRELGDSGAARMLQVVAAEYPNAIGKQALAESSGMSGNSGTFSTYLGRLRALELVEGRSDIRASAELFEE